MFSRLIPAALLLGQLPLAVFAQPIAKRSSAMPHWTLRGFHWNCSPDKSLCIYGFSLAEEAAPGEPAGTPALCHFSIRAKENETAYKAGFSDIPCDNLSKYRVASTFGENGYMILSVDNIEKQRRAYFNFNIAELENSEMSLNQPSIAYAVMPSSLPDYTDENSEDTTNDFDLAPVIPGSLLDDSDDPEETPVTGDASVLETLATQGNIATPTNTDETEDSNGDNNNDYNDYTERPVIEMSKVDTTEAEADDDSDPSDANTIAAVDVPVEEDADADENESPEIVFEVAYAGEATGYDLDDESYNTDEADEVPETLDAPIIAAAADADNGYANDDSTGDDSTDDDFADDGYVGDYEQANENLIVSPDDAIVAISDPPWDAPDSETSDSDYNDNDGYDATTILTVPTMLELWSVRNISRSFEYDPNAVHMQFAIDVLPDGPKSIPCTLRVDLDKNIDPMFASWFVQQCQDSGWFLSWGYNQMTESAVVTLINPERTKEAWFGWNSVNEHYPDVILNSVGPSIVQTCNC